MKKISKYFFIILQYCVPHHALSRFTGILAKSEIYWIKNILIKSFLFFFKVNLSEAEYSNLNNYKSFNDFFTRKLKKDAREIDLSSNKIISPVDGNVSEAGNIDDGKIIQAKGKYYTLSNLIAGDIDLLNLFNKGKFVTIYLAPKDYHRVHMPYDGKLIKTIYIPGRLFSVNKMTVESVNNLFARNERLVCFFQTENGPMILVMVGAMIVCGINTVWKMPNPNGKIQITQHNLHLFKGQEVGSFNLGSTVILISQENILWADELTSGNDIKLGESIATFIEREVDLNL